MKQEGKENDLLDRIRKDDTFKAVHDKLGLVNHYGLLLKLISLDSIMDPQQYVGRAPEQVENFIKNEVKPAISNFELGNGKAELTV